ncbi:Oidioi.mRNA.OKI2018_I69.chr2.g6796.t1.cds [Oikopleura dioica]|uniref:Oidioi.mRNA.OKI2018_I69.chr2.g6796.t1.cds n=1 Tax=Oikopleura dioica TaxID=34765 RepID=A0ABN7TDE0_OIKDI|nr:Oidioi.mRNA.OKI2018_I69.chr2.g6796.t1.cds [Oikopleura dioica]
MEELLEANLMELVKTGDIHHEDMRVAFFRLISLLSEYGSIFEQVLSEIENPLTWWLASKASSEEAIICLPTLSNSCDLLHSIVAELEFFEFDELSKEKLDVIIEVLQKKEIVSVPEGALVLWSKREEVFGDEFLKVIFSTENAEGLISSDLWRIFEESRENAFLRILGKIEEYSSETVLAEIKNTIDSWEDNFTIFTNCEEDQIRTSLELLLETNSFARKAENYLIEAEDDIRFVMLLKFLEERGDLDIISNPLSLAFHRAELIQKADVTLSIDENEEDDFKSFFDEISTSENITRAFEAAEILRDQKIGGFLKSELQKRVRLSVAVKAEHEPEKLVKLILEHSNEETEVAYFFDDHKEANTIPDVEDILVISTNVSNRDNFISMLSANIENPFSWGISSVSGDNSSCLVPLIAASSKSIKEEITEFFSEESIVLSFEENSTTKVDPVMIEECIVNFYKEMPQNIRSFFEKTIFSKIVEDKKVDWMETQLGEIALSIFDKSTPAQELKISFTALLNRHGGSFETMKRIFDQLKMKHLNEVIGDMVLAEKFLMKYIEIVILSSFVGDNKDSSVMENILEIQPEFFSQKERSIAFQSLSKKAKSSKIFSKFSDSGGKPGVFLRTNEDIELKKDDQLAQFLKQTVVSHYHLSEEKEDMNEIPNVSLDSILGVGKMSFVTIGRVTCEEELAELKVKNIKGSVLKVFIKPYSRSSLLKLEDSSVEKFLEPLSGVKFSDIGGTTRGFVLQTKFDMNLGQFLEKKGWLFKEDAPTLESRVFLLKKILEAIGYLHENNINHLNLKPSNVLITQDLAGRKTALDVCVRDLRDNNLKKNEMMLCPGFTSPEQFISSTISETSDLYPIARLILFCLLDNHLFWFLCSRPNTREVLQDHLDGLEQLPELMFCVKQNLSMSSDFRQNSVQQLKSKLPSMLGELKHASPRLKELFNFRPILKVPNSLWAGTLTGPSLPERISIFLENLNDPSISSECNDTYLKLSYFVCYSFKAAVDKELSPKGKLWTIENIMLLFTGAIYDEKCFTFVTSQYAKKDLNLFRILRRMMEMLCFGSLVQNAPWVDVIEMLNKDRPTSTRKVLELRQTMVKEGNELCFEVPVVTMTAEKIAMISLQKKMTLVQRQKEICLETEKEIDIIKCLKIDSLIRDQTKCENFSLNEECLYLQFS